MSCARKKKKKKKMSLWLFSSIPRGESGTCSKPSGVERGAPGRWPGGWMLGGRKFRNLGTLSHPHRTALPSGPPGCLWEQTERHVACRVQGTFRQETSDPATSCPTSCWASGCELKAAGDPPCSAQHFSSSHIPRWVPTGILYWIWPMSDASNYSEEFRSCAMSIDTVITQAASGLHWAKLFQTMKVSDP